MQQILILDDEDVSALVVEEMLLKLGYEVKRAARTAEAWEIMRKWPPDLLVLDTDLNGEDGVDFLRMIRGDAVFATLPVVVNSRITRREVVQRYLALGIQGMLVKPCTSTRLREEIARADRNPFRASIFESLEAVMARTQREPDDVAHLYRTAADEVWNTLADVAVLVTEPFNPTGLSKLFALKGCGAQAGCSVLHRLIEDALRAYNRLSPGPIRRAVDRLPVVVHLLRRQADEISPLPPAPVPQEVPAPAENPGPAGETSAPSASQPADGAPTAGIEEAPAPAGVGAP